MIFNENRSSVAENAACFSVDDNYKILSSSFLKIAGFSISVFLYMLCLRLFVENPRYTYKQPDAFFVWLAIISVFILCVFFAMFVFMKVSNAIAYLFCMYTLYFIECMLFFLILKTRAYTVSNAITMHRIILCLGFLFIFLEFLYGQISTTFVRDMYFLTAILGIISCVISLGIICMMYINHIYYMDFSHIFVFYIFFRALPVFILSLQRKEISFSSLYNYSFIFFLIFLHSFVPIYIGGIYYNRTEELLFFEIFIIFGFTQLTPFKYGQRPKNIAYFSMKKLILPAFFKFRYYLGSNETLCSNDEVCALAIGLLMFRLAYFKSLAMLAANAWWKY